MHEAEHALVRADAKPFQDLRIVGRQPGEPLRAETECRGRLQQRKADAASGLELLGLGNLVVRRQRRDDRDDAGRVVEAFAFLVDLGRRGVGFAF